MDLYIIFSMCKLLIKYPDLIVALFSLTVAFALGICQVCQANRVEAFERRLNDRDEKRYKDLVLLKIGGFVSFVSFLGIIPLLGFIFGIVGGICTTCMFAVSFYLLLKLRKNIGTNGILYCIIYLLVPGIGVPIALYLITKQVLPEL